MNKFTAYLRYFFYLAYYWNIRLAATILYYEIIGEKKYGLHTVGIDDLKNSISEEDRKNASIYQPVNYFIAEWLFSQLRKDDILEGTFLDAGCGKGRAMVMAAFAGFKTIQGIDISPKLCHEAIGILNDLQSDFPETNFEITCIDAQNFEVSDSIKVLFMFNPFNKKIMMPFIEQVKKSLQRKPRTLKLLYANPECGDLWENAGFTLIASKEKLNWLHGQVYEYQPDFNNKAGD